MTFYVCVYKLDINLINKLTTILNFHNFTKTKIENFASIQARWLICYMQGSSPFAIQNRSYKLEQGFLYFKHSQVNPWIVEKSEQRSYFVYSFVFVYWWSSVVRNHRNVRRMFYELQEFVKDITVINITYKQRIFYSTHF